MLNLDYQSVLTLIKDHHVPGKREESASFLIWYLVNYYRLDPVEACDAICDKRGDKGIDGIYVSESAKTIFVFQCKLSQSPNSTIGDKPLREFVGSLSQLKDQDSIKQLVIASGKSDLSRLINKLDLHTRILDHDVKGIFISNIDIDANGEAILKINPNVTFIGKSKLINSYISDARTLPVMKPFSFDITGLTVSEYTAEIDIKATIAPIKAKELIKLQGLADQSIFAFNVRGPLGRTQVNKDIIESIRDQETHKYFPLFHNGITIICQDVTTTKDQISINGYYVVNGCQSLTSLYDNSQYLTDDLRILTKFVKMDVESKLSESVTRFSNNQNGVKARDFMSNNAIQIRLQNEFTQNYNGVYSFEIKRGEDFICPIISNEVAGLYLMAFDLKEPWGTHRKYQVFEDKYSEIFARPNITADRIVLLHEIIQSIIGVASKIRNELFGKYALTKYAILYIVRLILEKDDLGKKIIANPELFVREKKKRIIFNQCIEGLLNELIIELNVEIDDLGEDFDYRGKLRDDQWISTIAKRVESSYRRLVIRDRVNSLKVEWDLKNKKP